MRWLLVLISALLVGGCDKEVSVAPDAGASHAAAAHCGLTVYQISESLRESESGLDVLPRYAQGCAAVYRRAQCRDAWMREGAKPAPKDAASAMMDPRHVAIAKACSAAYCFSLSPPKPNLCADAGAVGAAEVMAAWPALHATILERDLQDHPKLADALKIVFTPTVLPLDLPRGATDAGTQMVFGVEMTADGSMRIDGQQVVDDADLLQRAKRALADNSDLRAVIRADASASHGSVIHLLDILKQAGIKKIAFAVVPIDAGAP